MVVGMRVVFRQASASRAARACRADYKPTFSDTVFPFGYELSRDAVS
jgi:hypothetical protein